MGIKEQNDINCVIFNALSMNVEARKSITL